METKYNGGFIAILILLITGVVMVILMLQQYKESGLIRQQDTINTNTPIESAKSIKNVLETKNGDYLNY